MDYSTNLQHNADYSLLLEQICHACAAVNIKTGEIRILVNNNNPRENGETFDYDDYYVRGLKWIYQAVPAQYDKLSFENLKKLYREKGHVRFTFESELYSASLFTIDVYVPEADVRNVYIICRNARKGDLLSAIAEQFVYDNCDYFILLDGRQNRYVAFSLAAEDPTVPIGFCTDYETEIITYALQYCSLEEQDNTIYQMTLARVIDQLDRYGMHFFYTTVIENGEPRRKYIEYRYFNKEERMILLFRNDVTTMYNESHRYAQRLQEAINRAYSDSLTGLLNAQGMQENIKEKLQDLIQQEQEGEIAPQSALFFIDLDNFKQVNDQYGHLMGDQILKDVAEVLRNSVRDCDLAARVGGDEFELFVSHFHSASEARDLGFRILQHIEEIPEKHSFSVMLSCSIGIAFTSYDGTNYDHLIRIADERVYEAKRLGKRTVVSS